MNKNKFSFLNCSVGNIIEWYDFGLYSIYSALFGHLFFPHYDAATSILASFSVFSIGAICRPIGGLIFGYLGDKKGRAFTLKLSMILIAFPTFLIGLLPTYQSIGIWSTLILILLRMWQGICIGGEYSGSIIYLAEGAPAKRRGFYTSLASTGSNIGILLAALMGFLTSSILSNETLSSWGWRIPYLLSGLLSIFIFIKRLSIKESEIFIRSQKKNLNKTNPITHIFKYNLKQLGYVFGLVTVGTTFYYFCFVYLPIFFEKEANLPLNLISFYLSFYIAVMTMLIPCAGWLSDKMGRRKMLLFNSILITIILIPGYYFLHQQNYLINFMVLFVFTIASSLEQGTTAIAIVENLPTHTRYIGMSLGYNLGNGILGGTAPLICSWLATTSTYLFAPAVYISACAFISSLIIYHAIPETNGKNLYQMQ